MDISDFIRVGQEPPPLPFLIIGGYAVGLHGHTRATFDVDFLVRRSDKELWLKRLAQHGLQMFSDNRIFAQFSDPEGGEPLDLMFVDEPTFDRLWSASEQRDFTGVSARVPALDHLLALKLHALKQSLPHRTSKDAEDVEMLVRRNHLNLRDPHYEELFLKYGTREIYETFLRILQG